MATDPPTPLWTRCDLPPHDILSSRASLICNANISCCGSDNDDSDLDGDPSTSTSVAEIITNSNGKPESMASYAVYGPGELECYRHTLLQKAVKDAKLKVWYPGRWHRHSPHAYFRTRFDINSMQDLCKIKSHYLLHFHSNARIVSAELIYSEELFGCSDVGTKNDGQVNEEETLVGKGNVTKRKCHQLQCQSTSMGAMQNETLYDHVIVLSPGCIASIQSDAGIPMATNPCYELKLEVDTRMATNLDENYAQNENSKQYEKEQMNDADDETKSDLEESAMFPPPCIVMLPLEGRHLPIHQNHLPWEWKVCKNAEWIPISSCWQSPITSTINMQQEQSQHDQNAIDMTPDATDEHLAQYWILPHQMDLHCTSTVFPASQFPTDALTTEGGSNQNVSLICDFRKELLGTINISLPASLESDNIVPTVQLRVGETLDEAMNEDEEHFEQCLDLAYNLENGAKNSIHNQRHIWTSCHLLAFRYARVVIPSDYHHNDALKIAVETNLPLVEQQGSFLYGTDPIEPTQNQHQVQELDERIWHCAAYTLQCCIHNNFIVDGIKRDRLPWVGDLAVSLMANAYSFSDEECIRWTLVVLGRCGLDQLYTDADAKISDTNSHVNGVVDYSLWYIVSHWLYQRYFGDINFLQQEWRLIEQRLKCLVQHCSDKEKGSFITNKDDWVFIDWTVDGEKNPAVQILWWYTLDCGISLAQKVVKHCHNGAKKQSIRDSIFLFCGLQSKLEDSFLAMEDIQLGFTRHAHILGVVSGLYKRLDDRASEGDWSKPDSSNEKWQILCRCRKLFGQTREALMNNELTQVATPYMKHLECLAIARLGERRAALQSIRSYWGGMLTTDATTFFEAFNEQETMVDVAQFYDRPFARSLCHAWAAGPCALYPEILLGARPSSDGWEQWICDPLECVSSMSATIKTRYGIISLTLTPDNIEVFVPEGTTMIIMDRNYESGRHTIPRKTFISSQSAHDWSKKYRGWHHYPSHVIKPKPNIPGYDGIQMTDVPTIYQLPGEDETFYMSFIGFDGVGYQTFVAESTDLLHWSNMRLAMGYGEEGSFDYGGVVLGAFLLSDYSLSAARVLKMIDSKYYCLYGAYAKRNKYEPDPGYQGLASSEDGLVWNREKDESILSIYGPGVVKEWEKDSIYQPWLVEHEGIYYNFYNAKQMPQWIEQLGVATSKDLYHWERYRNNPILQVGSKAGSWDTQFTSDAKVFWDQEESHWVMFYFGVGKGGAHVMVAFSKDLIHWVKDPSPIYTAGANPSGLDKQYAHKISIVWNPRNETWYMFYCAVGDAGRGIGLITSRPLKV